MRYLTFNEAFMAAWGTLETLVDASLPLLLRLTLTGALTINEFSPAAALENSLIVRAQSPVDLTNLGVPKSFNNLNPKP